MVRKTHKKSDPKKKIEKHSACIVCSEKDKRKCDSKRKNLRSTMPVLCAVRKWLWNAGR
jgi:hypothetical protein